MVNYPHHPASFRDPSGFVFRANDGFYRQVNPSYAEDYECLMNSGLYRALTEKGLLIPHTEIPENLSGSPDWYKTLHPLQLPFISYAYEWSFDQLRDAALLTLRIMGMAMDHGMILKDATPFNIQFHKGKPVFIDTLSFEKHVVTRPWVAYRQFCECFLYPLYLEHYKGLGPQKILTAWPEGIPAGVTAGLLPLKSCLNVGVWMHIRLQNMIGPGAGQRSRGQRKGAQEVSSEGKAGTGQGGFSQQKLRHLVQNLETIVKGLRPKAATNSTWNNYYGTTILSRDYLDEKTKIFRQFIGSIPFTSALDIGSNEGFFSRILAEKNVRVLAVDSDPACIADLYRTVREKNIPNILPLCIDLSNPSPAIGFRNAERSSFTERARAELVIALALVHHLVLTKNIPFADIADYLTSLTTDYLIIEFVPLEDEKAQELIRNKETFHKPYDAASFKEQLARHFSIEREAPVPGTARILFLMKKREA